jgi:hypothetical protein
MRRLRIALTPFRSLAAFAAGGAALANAAHSTATTAKSTNDINDAVVDESVAARVEHYCGQLPVAPRVERERGQAPLRSQLRWFQLPLHAAASQASGVWGAVAGRGLTASPHTARSQNPHVCAIATSSPPP